MDANQEAKRQKYEYVAKAMYLVLEQGEDSVKSDMIKAILNAANTTVYG